MSSIEFHEDEWGRNWSYAPVLHGTQRPQPFSLTASFVGGIAMLAAAIAEHWAAQQRNRALEGLSDAAIRDIFSEDELPPLRHSRYGYVRDEFDRPVI